MNAKSGIKAPSKPSLPKPTRSATGRNDSISSLSRSSSVSTLASVAEGKEVSDGQEEKIDFVVGEKVWVNGTKSGIIQYLGETQFAPGVWAGISLEEAVGKNDGSVNGVRYFQCEPLRGMFIRPHRLTRQAGSPPSLDGDSSSSQLNQTASSPTTSLLTSPNRHACSKMKTGDRVLVSSVHGNKSGIVRFLGTTEFAVGEWAGVELDLPTGKNDGSVGGIRYFSCKMKHGLFSPISKVSPYSTNYASPGSASGSMLKNRSYSRESLNSSTSSVSSSKLGHVKLGVNSLGGTRRSPGTTSKNVQNALQEVLKEKQEHIEQLLKERDMDREEVARTANQVVLVEEQLSTLQKQHASFVQENEAQMLYLKDLCDKSDMERKQLSALLDEEKRKMEDLQFRLEEEMILKSDLESQAEKERQKIKELENQVMDVNKSQVPQEQFSKTEAVLQEKDNEIALAKSEVEKLTAAMKSKDEQIAELMTSVADLKGKSLSLESDSIRKTELESKLKDLEEQFQTVSSAKNNLMNEMSGLMKVIGDHEEKQKEQQIKIDNLKNSMEKKIEEMTRLAGEVEQHKLVAGSKDGLEKELLELRNSKEVAIKASNERIQELTLKIESLTADLNQKESLASGDADKIQCLHQSLTEKDAEIQRLQQSLTKSKQTHESESMGNAAQLKALQEKVTQLTEDSDKLRTLQTEKEQHFTAEMQKIVQERKQLESEIQSLKTALKNKDKDVEKSKLELESWRKEVSLLNQNGAEQMSVLQNKISELQNSKADAEKREQLLVKEAEVLTQKQKSLESEIQNLKISLENKSKDLNKFKLELEESNKKAEDLSRGDSERILGLQNRVSELMKDIETARVEAEKREGQFKKEKESAFQEQKQLETKIHSLIAVVEGKDNDIKKLRSELEDSKREVTLLGQGSSEQISGLQKKVSELKNLIDSTNSEAEQKKQKYVTEIEALSQERNKLESNVKDLKNTLESKDKDLAKLKLELDQSVKEIENVNQGSTSQVSSLQSEISKMRKEMEDLKKESGQAVEHVESEKQLLISRLNEKDALISQQEQMSKKYEDTLQQKEKVILDLEASVNLYIGKMKEDSERFDEKEKLLASKLQQIELSMGSSVGEKQESIKSLESKLSELKSVLEGKEQECTQKQKEVLDLKSAVQQKEDQITELGQLVELSQAKLEQIKLQNNNNVTLLENRIAEFKEEQDKHFIEKEKILGSEIERLQAELQKTTTDLEKSVSEVTSSKLNEKALQDELQKHKELLAQNESDKSTNLSQASARYEDLEKQLKLTQANCDKLKTENEEVIKQAKIAQEACQESEKSKNSLIQDNMKHLALIEDRDKKLECLQNEVERMRKEFTQHKDELQQKLDVSQIELQAMKDFKTQLELQHEVLEELQLQLQESENKCEKLNSQLQEQLNSSEEKKQLDLKVKELQDILNNTMTKLADEEEVSQILRKQLDGNEAILKLKNEELDKLKSVMPKNESNEMANLKAQLTKLNEEKSSLSQELTKMKTTSAASNPKEGNPAGDAEWLEEKEGLVSQVNFLNSIIVDMQRKNEEMKRKLESNETEPDSNLNGLKAPRLFCDICDVFDLHETEDCPKQCAWEEDEEVVVPHSKHNGKRNEERPYCNNCEVFGHWTLDCDQEETF